MSLIKSISGIRGTIGGVSGENLTPLDIVESASAYGYWLLQNGKNPKVVIGRDARISGEIVSQLVVNTLRCLGISVVDLGLSTTPTVEIAVPIEEAGGGIILTASHNPKEWNALKLLNDKGEFISAADGQEVLDLIESGEITYAEVDKLGGYETNDTYIAKHIEQVLNLPLVDIVAVQDKKFKIVVDCINSTGAISIPPLLEKMGCECILLNEEMTGVFAHNPEPLPANLRQLSSAVLSNRAQLGIVVDPDVDRLAFVCEDGEMFGEEYTLVACADYVLGITPGNTVSNMSSTRALRDVTEKHGGMYEASAVGEVNVVNLMKKNKVVIGGEGNGGIIYPDAHYGRDALVGVALFLSLLADRQTSVSALRKTYPSYFMGKKKIQLTPGLDVDGILKAMEKRYQNEQLTTIDGVKIDFSESWVHLRKSNTEPIIRIYTEAKSQEEADALGDKFIAEISEIAGI